uniref:Uncharacterized protein n=1 Tax=Anopheles epiroticus TaxID=199890 RepID=A0A182PWT5_9DIPT
KDYRVSPLIFEEIIHDIKQEITSTRSNGITSEQKLAVVLRYFAEGSFQQSVGKDFKVPVANSTFSIILKQVLPIMERKLCPKYVGLNMRFSLSPGRLADCTAQERNYEFI